jgi:hypothetical protein
MSAAIIAPTFSCDTAFGVVDSTPPASLRHEERQGRVGDSQSASIAGDGPFASERNARRVAPAGEVEQAAEVAASLADLPTAPRSPELLVELS